MGGGLLTSWFWTGGISLGYWPWELLAGVFFLGVIGRGLMAGFIGRGINDRSYWPGGLMAVVIGQGVIDLIPEDLNIVDQ